MAGERTLPGIGLTGFWDAGSAYKAGMDANLRLLSALVQPVVDSSLADDPASPSDGDIHRATGDWSSGAATTGQIVVRDAGAWVAITPSEGWEVYDAGADARLRFDGSAWATVAEGGGGGASGISLATPLTADHSVTDTDLAGNVYREIGDAADLTVTVPSGLTGTEPVIFERTGAGAVTFAAGSGVTINSADGALALRAQYSSATLVPKGSDTYALIGDLAA